MIWLKKIVQVFIAVPLMCTLLGLNGCKKPEEAVEESAAAAEPEAEPDKEEPAANEEAEPAADEAAPAADEEKAEPSAGASTGN